MKKQILFFAMLLALTGLFTLQSCQDEDGTILAEYNTWNVPLAVSPANEAVLAPATTTTLEWLSTGGASNKWNVYFGEDPELIATNHTSQSINVDIEEGKTYYWYVTCEDSRGIPTESPEFSFTVKVTLNIDNFVGAYDCDEPGYAVYTVNSTKINANTIEIDNFWDSGYAVQYVFDDMGNVTITPKVVNVSTTKTYTITGSGTYDNTTGEFVVDYTVVQKVYTYANYAVTVVSTTVDSNTHTFVPQP